MNKLINIIDNFLKISEEDIFELFSRTNHAFIDGFEDKKFLYIPGDRQDKVLLVSHVDTVWKNNEISTKIENGIISSDSNQEVTIKNNRKENIGIGADDRAGVSLLWAMRDLGHSILLTAGEESGCSTAKWLNEDTYWSKKLNDHMFMLEFDRRGRKDIVFYESGTYSFANYLNKTTGFKPTTGGFGSDIKYFCKDICAANISCGFYDEHKNTERLVFKDWHNTLVVFRGMLSEKQQKFPLEKDKLWRNVVVQNYVKNNNATVQYNSSARQVANDTKLLENLADDDEPCIICERCNSTCRESTLIKNDFSCVFCQTKDRII